MGSYFIGRPEGVDDGEVKFVSSEDCVFKMFGISDAKLADNNLYEPVTKAYSSRLYALAAAVCT